MLKTRVAGGCVVALSMVEPCFAQDPFYVQFERAYGTSGNETARSAVQTADQGFIAIGRASTPGDIFIVKTDSNGDVQWQITLDEPVATLEQGGVLQAGDGGFVIAATISPSPLPASLGSDDAMMIKLDANGVEQWRTVLPGTGYDLIYNVVLANDGSFVGAGYTESPEIPAMDPGSGGVYVVKVSDTGAILGQAAFDKVAGTETWEEAYNIVAAPDGGFLITGVDYTTGQWFLLRLAANLAKQWGAYYGTQAIQAVENTLDGGFIAAGADLDTEDAVLVKLDLDSGNPAGPLVIRAGWPRTYSTPLYEIFYRAMATPDGGYFAAGHQQQIEGDPNSDHVWGVKVDANGDVVREGVFAQGATVVGGLVTSDGGYVIIGRSTNLPSGPGGNDVYIVKLVDIADPGEVTGTVAFDEDSTCSLTAGDIGTRYRMVKLVDDSSADAFLAMSNAEGTWRVDLPPGDYTATLAPNAVNQEPETCGPGGQSYALNVSAGSSQDEKNLLVTCTCDVNEALSGGPLSPAYSCPSGSPSSPCPGYPWEICYDVTNLCDKLRASTSNGNFVRSCIDLPPGMVYNGGAPTIGGSGCTSLWQRTTYSTSQVCFEQNAPFHFVNNCERNICFPVDVTVGFNGGAVTAQFSTDPDQCGTFPPASALDYDTNCACDPNEMHVEPGGCGASGAITAQELTYRVDFQNLGAGPAHDVVITDALDADLDLDTFRLVDASHEITGLQVGDGELVVRFEGIELPPEVFDAAGSHGHVTFAITPSEPFVDGTAIENGASIVFDTNAPVITNTALSTLYHGDPVPVVDFESVENGDAFDFSYTGGTSDATFAWDFGANATPRTSTDANPSGIAFSGPGDYPVRLVATKAGCDAAIMKSQDVPCTSVWSASAFESPVGTRPRRSGSTLRLRTTLSYDGELVASAAQLEGILVDDFGYAPDSGCWPRVRVFTEDLQQELTLGAEDFAGIPANPDGCFRFGRKGKLTLKLKLKTPKFLPGENYVVQMQGFTCPLSPPNNLVEMKTN